MADDTTPAQAPIVVPPTPAQLPVPTDTTLSGDNWARNLALFGGQLAQANNARFGAGFLQNPGISALPIGIANTFNQASALDAQAANTQNTLAEAEARRIGNTQGTLSLESYKRWLNSPLPMSSPGSVSTNLLPNEDASNTSSTPLPKASASGDIIIPQDRLSAMTAQGAKASSVIPSGVGQKLATIFSQGIIPTESSSNANPALVNPKSGAFGIAGLMPSTVRDPGYGMQGQDPATLKNDPQAQINFAMEYAYRRATAPISKGGLGMTDADFDNPGMISHLVSMYGGASSPQAAQEYVGKVANNILTNTGRQKMGQVDTPETMMTGALTRNNGGQPVSAPPSNVSPLQAQAEASQAQRQVDPATAEAQSQAQDAQQPKPYQVASTAPTAPPMQPPANQPLPADGSPNMPPGSNTADVDTVMQRLRADPANAAAQTPTEVPQGGNAPAPAAPSPQTAKPQQITQAAPVAASGTSLPAPTSNPVPQPGSRAEQQQIAASMPPQMRQAITTLTAQAQQNFELASYYARGARFDPTAKDTAAQYQARGLAAQEQAQKLYSDYVQERAKIGTWVDDTRNGVAGQTNQTTQEFKPYTTGAGRPFQMPDGSAWMMPPGGGQPVMVSGPNNPGVADRKSAESQGTATGTAAGNTQTAMKELAKTSGDNIANIDNGLAAFQKAQQNGITPGLLAPYRLDADKFLKSAIGTSLFGNNSAVADATVGEKSATIVSAALLQRMVDKGTLTDAKLAHMAPALPDLHTDPDAIQHLLEYARMQDVYNNRMANDALKNTDPKTGLISPGWEANYLYRNGSGPIYDPTTGSTRLPKQVPDGQGGMRAELPGETPIPQIMEKKPTSTPTPTPAAPIFKIGDTATGPNGKTMTYTADGWK